MISARLLNSDASLNIWTPQTAITFVTGENVRIVVQILNAVSGIRYIPPSAATLTFTLTNEDESQLVVPGTLLSADDRSIWYIDLSQAQSALIASNNLLLSLDVNGDESLIYLASVQNGLIRMNLSGECC